MTTPIDTQAVEAFGERILDAINGGALTLMLSVGHRTGLFDVLAAMPPASSEEISRRPASTSATCASGWAPW